MNGPIVLVLMTMWLPAVADAAPLLEGGRHLDGFRAALDAARRNAGTAHVLHFGASHTSADWFTDHMRRRFQATGGDGGHGFLMPVVPWTGYRHLSATVRSSGGWECARTGVVGLLGVACTASGAGAESTINMSGKGKAAGREIELTYVEGPDGGRFDLWVDGRALDRVSSRGPVTRLAVARYRLPRGARGLRIRTRGGGAVTLLGLTMERMRAGVVLDTLGIPGTTAWTPARWHGALWQWQARRRRPDLVVLWWGTNESRGVGTEARYYRRLSRTVALVKGARPEASCLLIGPTDNRFEALTQVIRVQRRVARETGCAFFDARVAMGGPGGMRRWIGDGLARADGVHLTRRGYQQLAETLLSALRVGY